MKTLKRIGLFLGLKLKEISLPVLCIILIFGIIYLMLQYCPLLFTILLILGTLLTIGREILIVFLEWVQDNWREVKRRIP